MESVQEIFDYYDNDNDGIINETCFKQIINTLGLSLDNIEKKQYNYNDLNNYILNESKKNVNIMINKNKIHKILSEHLNENDADFILNDLGGTCNIDLFKLSNYLAYPNIVSNQNNPQ